MRTSLPVIFSIFLISSLMVVSSVQNSFSDEVIATSVGFEDSTMLELKNSRGNMAEINSIRIWLSGDNEFKSFKTEQGWTGKNTPQGVIIFTPENTIKPGESVKIGIKTLKQNPTINWKAIDVNEEVIASASTKISNIEVISKPELNQPKMSTIKEDSIFRFIPEKPTSGSDFRVIGENFVPNQKLDFYIGNNFEKTINVDRDGKILFTSQTPTVSNDERTEFTLQDSGGNEKTISIRIPDIVKRQIADIIKLSLGNTPQDVKRGDTVILEGMATPNTTLTITTKHPNGDILSINTIVSGFDGKWIYENLFSPESELGPISIEISDGKTTALRNINIISAKLINITSEETMYNPGDSVLFVGTAIPNEEMSIIVEDSIGTEIFSRSISVGETGNVNFNIDIPRGSVDGTYVLLTYQGDEEGISIFGIGQEPQPILVLRPTQLNYSSGENAKISIQGPANAQISLILIDSADRVKFSDSINLGPDGNEMYEINTNDLPTGAFSLNAERGESSGSTVFTIGLTTGSGAISIQTTRDDYKQGEQVLILGNTGSINVLLDITITDPEGKTVKKIETFSDRFGVFKVDNFRIPSDAKAGVWDINAKSGGNFKDTVFNVSGGDEGLVLITNKNEYEVNELIEFSGSGVRPSAVVSIKILDLEGNEISKVETRGTNVGEFEVLWRIPGDFTSGEYEITADDGMSNVSLRIIIK